MRASMRWNLRLLMCAALVASLCAGLGAAAPQELSARLKSQVLERYRVLPLSDGIVLAPRHGSGASIELNDRGIAIDGTAVTGRELRERLGKDADLILQLSYVDPAALRAAFGGEAPATPAPPEATPAPAPSEPPAATTPPTVAPEPVPAPPEPPPSPKRMRHGAKVTFLRSITVDEDEEVTDAVVAIGGNVEVNGHVREDVVAVLGSVRLGPHAVVDGSVTSVGGRVDHSSGAEVHGEINEVAIGHDGEKPFRFVPFWVPGMGHDVVSGSVRLFGTLLRIALVLLLALIIVVAAQTPVDRIARRAGDDALLSGFVGLLFQVLVVPLTVLVVVVLAISIIGIPLLVLVPFALLALFFGVLLGFVGVARRVGEWVAPSRGALVGTTVGVVIIAAGTILARLVWLLPAPVGVIAFIVAVAGFFMEYVAWTVGIGAMLLTRFGTRGPGMEPFDRPTIVPPIPALDSELRSEL
jgi:hypothetical protein